MSRDGRARRSVDLAHGKPSPTHRCKTSCSPSTRSLASASPRSSGSRDHSSFARSGRRYEWAPSRELRLPVAPMPGWLLELVRHQREHTAPLKPVDPVNATTYGRAALRQQPHHDCRCAQDRPCQCSRNLRSHGGGLDSIRASVIGPPRAGSAAGRVRDTRRPQNLDPVLGRKGREPLDVWGPVCGWQGAARCFLAHGAQESLEARWLSEK